MAEKGEQFEHCVHKAETWSALNVSCMKCVRKMLQDRKIVRSTFEKLISDAVGCCSDGSERVLEQKSFAGAV